MNPVIILQLNELPPLDHDILYGQPRIRRV